jgi:hypothetical protein
MAGNCSAAHAKGRLSLVKERGRARFEAQASLSFPTPHLHPLPRRREEARKGHAKFPAGHDSRATTSCGRMASDPFKLCDFALVTPTTLLY